MTDYALFGGCLRSDIEIAIAHAGTASAPTWTIRIVQQLAREDLHLFGETVICAGVRIRLYHHRNGFRLTYTDSGSFDIVDGGRAIQWLPGDKHRIELVRLDIINFVMATALHAGGTLCLHASAVAPGGTAVAFIGPKRSGKSTLAMALARAGAPLVCDDMLAVSAGPPPAALPGVQNVRLEPDARAYFDGRLATDGLTSESTFDSFTHDAAGVRPPTPLGALYVLAPARDRTPATHVIRRERLGPAESIMAIQANAKIAHLLGVEGAAALLKPVTRLVGQVPVYRLTIAHDLAGLPAAVDTLRAWHGDDARRTTAMAHTPELTAEGARP